MVSCHTDYATPGAWNLRADCFVGWSERVRACYDTDYMTIHFEMQGGKRSSISPSACNGSASWNSLPFDYVLRIVYIRD